MTVIRINVNNTEHVDVDAYEFMVHLHMGEGNDFIDMTLGPDDARAVAAVLVHQAGEVER